MKIAVSSMGEDLGSDIDPRFGRCGQFLLVETDSREFEVVNNDGKNSVGGAGIAAAQLIADNGAEAVITGDVGPNAILLLKKSGIEVFTGADGTVGEALDKFLQGRLADAKDATVSRHGEKK
jgi:predicted Fe-Mo cluster-binding NifX family protein